MKEKSITLASGAEDKFIEIFSEVFGPEKTGKLILQYGVEDIYGGARYIDFAIITDKEKVAIEIDGEGIHEPGKVSHQKYYDDLLKQNSLMHKNWKVYRWTDGQLKQYRDKVKDEMYTFLSDYIEEGIAELLPKQKGAVLNLYEHQEDALENLREMRKNGETIGLVYHATGTGKTLVAVEDSKEVGGKTLFIAHTKELVEQGKGSFDKYSEDKSTGIFMGEIKEKECDIVCASIQSLSQNLDKFDKDEFNYIVIDEAHHAGADTYKKVLGYFKPSFTLGVTATPERADGEDILDIFTNVAHKLDLKEAVEKGILAEIRCIRVKTNVDLSDVRIRGIKYDTKDLEAKLFVPERNNIIVQTYLNYVSGKRTVIFCASVANAEEIAYLLRKEGVKAEAVSGGLKKQKREKILSDYENGKIQVLCACDLLNEGWDSPKTEVLFMARPTMSKTIYMQQLGRGTRKAEGKDEILVFDFIDGANLYNTPLSAHRMFNMEQYVPGGLLVGKSSNMAFENQLLKRGEKPVELLDLPIDVKDMEYIDLFNWYEDAKNMISQIEFVRMVNVQGETVSKYIREGKILADLEVPCANGSFKYFKEESVKAYAEEFGWKLIDNNNLKDMFMEFVEKMDMSYSYKPVLLKGMIECMDDKGRVLLEELVDYFVDFYEERKSRGLEAEKKKSLYNEDEIDRKKALKNILSNPFKRFEDMRFMERCKDVEYVMFNKFVFKKLSFEDRVLIDRICDEKLKGYFKE